MDTKRDATDAEGEADWKQLDDRIEELASIARALGRAPAVGRKDRLVVTQTTSYRDELMELLRLEERDEEAYEKAVRSYLFWTYQDVMDRYGTPDDVYHRDDGKMTWDYEFVLGEDDEGSFTFVFADGMVINVW